MLFKRKSITTAFGPVAQKDYDTAVDSIASKLVDQALCAVGDRNAEIRFRLVEHTSGDITEKMVSVSETPGKHLLDFPLGMWPWFQAFLFQRIEGGMNSGHIKVQSDSGHRKMLFIDVEYLIGAQDILRVKIKK